jgi:hypothetical protein|tara:strand:+ start:1558 stop:2169 length:612 start_codon:yes stop_codon:yes gene_type:complete
MSSVINYHKYRKPFKSYLLVALATFFIFGCSGSKESTQLQPIDITQNLAQANQVENIQTYTDPNINMDFDFPKSWTVFKPEGDQTALVEIYSPDSSIVITVLHDYPPPMIDLKSYGDALINNIKLETPSMKIINNVLTREERKYIVNYSIGVPNLQGSLLITMRDTKGLLDSLIIQSVGESDNYQAWEEEINIILDSITLNLE